MNNVISKRRSFHRLFLFAALGIGIVAGTGFVGCSTRVEPPVSTPSQVATQGQAERGILESKKGGNETITGEAPINLRELSVDEERGQTILHMRFSKPVSQYRHFPLVQPSRIVLDILEVLKPLSKSESFSISTNLVGTLRLTSGEGYLRMVVDVATAAIPPYEVVPEDSGLRIVIGGVNPAITVKKEERLVHEGNRVFVHTGPSEEKKYSEPKIILDFQDVEIQQVFGLLTELSGKNIVVTEDVKKKVTIKLKEPIPWDQALDLLIDTNGLGKEQVGNVIRISTLAQLTKDRDDRTKAEKAKESEGPIQTVYLNVNYAKVKELADKIQKIKSPVGIMVADDQTNTIFVRDIQRVINEAKAIASNFDLRTPQVHIESNLIETSPTFSRALGFELGLTKPGVASVDSFFPAGEPFGALGATLSVIQNRFGPFRNVNATLTAAEQDGRVRIISRPSVLTLNNEESTMKSTRIVRVQLPASGSSTVVGGGGASQNVAVQDIEVGITLKVTPQVSKDGFVLMKIDVKSSSLGSRSSGAAIPDELSRQAIANVLVRDGETIVLGGIMKDTTQDSEGGIPYLKEIPVLGWLFKNTSYQKNFEELMVFITPRVISSGSTDIPDAEQLWRDQLKKTEGDRAVYRLPAP